MRFLNVGEATPVDRSFPLAVRVAGLQPGDTVEVRFGAPGAEQAWLPRTGPLPWLRPTPTVGEFMVDPAIIPDRFTFVATMAGHRAVGATVTQMGGTGQSWSHPGATAREGERWAFLTFALASGTLEVTARDEPADRAGGSVGATAFPRSTAADAMTAVVDLSASMAASAADGRLATALAAIQLAASRSKLTAITVTFVGGDRAKRVHVPVAAAVGDAIGQAIGEIGWRTGTVTDLLAAATDSADRDVVTWLVTDAAPASPPTGRPAGRIGFLVICEPGPAAAPGGRDGPAPAVYLAPGQPAGEVAERLLAAAG